MSKKSAASSYRFALPARWLHWAVAAAVPAQLWLGWSSDRAQLRNTQRLLIHTHFQFGVIIFILVVVRLSWRLLRGSPPPLPDAAWRLWMARGAHALLYALLLMLPASGYIIWVWSGASMNVLGLFELPRFFVPPTEDERGRAWAWYVHHCAAFALAALALLHAAAAFWHELVRHDEIVSRRML